MVRLLSFAAFAASLSLVSAVPGTLLFPRQDREFGCGTETTPEDIANFQELASLGSYEGNEALKARARAVLTRQAPVYPWGKVVIDTWFHVIAESTNITDGYIPQEQLDAQLAVLNRDFASHNFAFALKGVTRTINPAWANDLPGAQLASKRALRKGDYATLNIYFLKNLARGSLGYAYYPRRVPTGSDEFYLDGATNNAFTVPGGTLSPYNLGGTVTHEVGHWMNLAHTFGSPPYSCTTSTDFIADTPAQLGPTSGCPVGRDSCPDQPGLDPINNYMDYSIDRCYTEFTPLQTKRMWDAWFFYRRPRACNADNCLRGLRAATIPGRLQESQAFCSVITTDTIAVDAASFPKYAVDACSGNFASRISSACTCLPETTTTRPPVASSTTTSATTSTTTL